jgi:hypothetical protein
VIPIAIMVPIAIVLVLVLLRFLSVVVAIGFRVRTECAKHSIRVGALHALLAIARDHLTIRCEHAPVIVRAIAIDDSRIRRHASSRRCAIGRGRLLSRWNTVDPDSALPGGRPLARGNSVVASAATLCHRRRRNREQRKDRDRFDFPHSLLLEA